MTKYSIKIRRNKLTKGKIESHKDFKALQQMSVEKHDFGKTNKLLAIIFAIILLVVMTLLGIQKINESSTNREQEDVPSVYDEFKQ